jgi:NADH-quinone oxidoreductase subunit M
MGGLMRVMPFASVCWVVAGFASLGLPGLSGFVAEMTVFVGSWMEGDLFRRVLTVVAASSIVVTAVYILRTVGKILYGPVVDPHHEGLSDAAWWERVAAAVLIGGIVLIGVWPGGVRNVIADALAGVNIF